MGGNNILKYTNKNMNINILFEEYEHLLRDLIAKFDKCKIVLFNLYTPPNINKIRKDDTLTDKIKQWNNALDAYLYKNNNILHFNYLRCSMNSCPIFSSLYIHIFI